MSSCTLEYKYQCSGESKCVRPHSIQTYAVGCSNTLVHIYQSLRRRTSQYEGLFQQWYEDLKSDQHHSYFVKTVRNKFRKKLFSRRSGKQISNIMSKWRVYLKEIHVRLTFQSLVVYLRTTRFNIQKFYMTLALRSVLYLSQNRRRLSLYTSLTDRYL